VSPTLPRGLRAFRQHRAGLAVALALLLVACASPVAAVRVTRLTPRSFEPTLIVQVLDRLPRRPCRVLARIVGDAPAGTRRAQLLASMQQEAGKLGADAIVIDAHQRQAQAMPSIRFNPSGGGLQQVTAASPLHVEALAIRFAAGAGKQSR
jgi:hypothetical protein